MPLRAVDVQVGQLKLIGGVFEQTRLQLHPGPQALDVRLDGPSLAAAVLVDSSRGRYSHRFKSKRKRALDGEGVILCSRTAG